MIESVRRKSMIVRYSGRSSDYITPTIGHGCLYKCTYCYMRRNKPYGLNIATNLNDIINTIDKHVDTLPWPKKPNQTHEKYYTYDFACLEDYILHLKYHDWKTLFTFFKEHPKVFGTAATKYVNNTLLESNFNPNKKIRIRFSLMPQQLSTILEPNTSKIQSRLEAVDKFIEKGYEVHLNFSPVIVEEHTLELYKQLFQQVDATILNKQEVLSEVIFLTHNKKLHEYNLKQSIPGERLLWKPEIQEDKVSSYGSENIRYKHALKRKFINNFINLHNDIIPWNTIRYIF